MTPDHRTVRRHLMSWGSGSPAPLGSAAADRGDACATVLVESSAHIPELRSSGVIGTGTVVLAPDEGEGAVAYTGGVADPGQELALGEFFLQIQDYATSPYMTILGPTLVRLFGGEDHAAFLADADAAREQGTFPPFATAPMVQLGDVPGLGADDGADGPGLRLHVDSGGAMSTSPAGATLGTVGATPRDLAERHEALNDASRRPCAVCLAGAVAEEERVAALEARPWLPAYLHALDALRDLQARGIAEARVSGFGGRMDPRLADRPAPGDDDLPLLLWTEDATFARAPGTGRTFALPVQAGPLAEALLVCGSVAEAGALAGAAELEQVAAMFSSEGVELVRERAA